MKISTGEKLGFAIIEPSLFCNDLAFGTMPISAGVVGDLFIATLVAFFNMPTQCGGAACLNMAHYLILLI
jgi:hypothetical protein